MNVLCQSIVNYVLIFFQGDVNSSWTHDMYDGPKRQIRGGLSTTNIHKIVISNLDFGVTSTDIQV